ncbi:Uncharacterised protein [Vibrio cholerae]|nr:Uncharacterised protein [Vibrio cholerae]
MMTAITVSASRKAERNAAVTLKAIERRTLERMPSRILVKINSSSCFIK